MRARAQRLMEACRRAAGFRCRSGLYLFLAWGFAAANSRLNGGSGPETLDLTIAAMLALPGLAMGDYYGGLLVACAAAILGWGPMPALCVLDARRGSAALAAGTVAVSNDAQRQAQTPQGNARAGGYTAGIDSEIPVRGG